MAERSRRKEEEEGIRSSSNDQQSLIMAKERVTITLAGADAHAQFGINHESESQRKPYRG